MILTANPNLKAALAYAARGLAVFPVYGKVPATKRGFKDATTNPEQISTWWGRHPTWGIGCPIPDNFIVIDVDAKNDGLETLRQLEEEYGVPETRAALTGGGGLHLWFRYRGDDLRQGAGLLGPGIDTRVPGKGYVVLPPSAHASGIAYEWGRDTPTADLPEWMAEKLRAPERAIFTGTVKDGIAVNRGDEALAYKRLQGAADAVRRAPEGQRNETLNAMSFLAGKMIHRGVDHEDAFDTMVFAGLDAGQGSMTEGTVNSGLIAGYDSGPGPEHGGGVQSPLILLKSTRGSVHKPSQTSSSASKPKSQARNLEMPLATHTILDLLSKEFEPLRWTVEDLVPEGLTLLVGTTKVGKSFLSLLMALKVAAGKPFLGLDTSGGDVLYIHLEDGYRRIQERVRNFGADKLPHMDRFYHYEEWPQFGAGGVEQLDQWVQEHPETTLIVIDTVGKMRAMGSGKDPYGADYQLYGGLQSWALKHRIALVGVHHTNKGGSKELQDRISGTRGVAGAADTTLMLDRKAGTQDGRLATQGRDGPELDLSLQFGENGLWSNRGEFWQWEQDTKQGEVEKAIKEFDGEATVAQIAQLVSGTERAIKGRLATLLAKGLVTKVRHGVYGLPIYSRIVEPDEGPTLF